MERCWAISICYFPCLQKGNRGWHISGQPEPYPISLTRNERLRGVRSGENIFPSSLLLREVRGITLTGFKYPLHGKDIEIGTSLCISNELQGREGAITLYGRGADCGGIPRLTTRTKDFSSTELDWQNFSNWIFKTFHFSDTIGVMNECSCSGKKSTI